MNDIGNRLLADIQSELGVSKAVAAGIVGNLAHESAGFKTLQEIDPLVKGSRGGYGYAQWTGSRRKSFEKWSEENGLNPSSYEANKGYLIHELTNTPESRVMNSLANVETPDQAAQIFSDEFLRPGIPHNDKRIELANMYSDQMIGGQGEDTLGRQISLPDGRTLSLTGSETPEQLNALRDKLRSKYQTPQTEARSEDPSQATQGNDAGSGNAFAYGVTGGAVPFGNRITSGLGAGMATAYDKLSGMDSGMGLKEYYEQSLADTWATQDANPKSTLAGNVTGLATTLPLLSTTALTGTRATEGARGALNAVPEGLAAVSNFVRGGEKAKGLARVGQIGLQGAKGAAVAAPSGALYSAGEAKSGRMLDAAKDGLMVGGGVGLGLPVAGAALNKAVGAIIPKIDDAVAPLVKRAKDFGISLRADQIAPTRARNTMQKVSQSLPFSGVDDFERTQRQQWTKAVARTIGQDSDDLSPEVIKKFLKETGETYDNVLKGKEFNFTRLDKGMIDNIIIDAESTLDEGLAKVVRKNAEGLLKDLSVDGVKGEKLSSIRSELLKRSTRAQGGAKEYLSDLVELVDDIVEDELPEAAANSLRDVRRKYRNFKTLEPLLEKGEINPTQLMQKVATSRYIKSSRSSVGDDDLVDLARIGKELLVKKGGSDTFEKGAYTIGGGSALGNLATGGAAFGVDMGLTGGALLANRGLQKINSNQKLISAALKPSQRRLANYGTQSVGNKSPIFLD